MKRDRLMVGEVLRRTAKVVTELADEHDLDDDAVHSAADSLEELAHEYLGMPRLPVAVNGRDALDQLIEGLEDMAANPAD